jgi:hypothetical protein
MNTDERKHTGGRGEKSAQWCHVSQGRRGLQGQQSPLLLGGRGEGFQWSCAPCCWWLGSCEVTISLKVSTETLRETLGE